MPDDSLVIESEIENDRERERNTYRYNIHIIYMYVCIYTYVQRERDRERERERKKERARDRETSAEPAREEVPILGLSIIFNTNNRETPDGLTITIWWSAWPPGAGHLRLIDSAL